MITEADFKLAADLPKNFDTWQIITSSVKFWSTVVMPHSGGYSKKSYLIALYDTVDKDLVAVMSPVYTNCFLCPTEETIGNYRIKQHHLSDVMKAWKCADPFAPEAGWTTQENNNSLLVSPKNNDGRDYCFKCNEPTKIVQGFRSLYSICPKCGV